MSHKTRVVTVGSLLADDLELLMKSDSSGSCRQCPYRTKRLGLFVEKAKGLIKDNLVSRQGLHFGLLDRVFFCRARINNRFLTIIDRSSCDIRHG